MEKYFLFHKCKNENGQEISRFIATLDSKEEIQKVIDNLKDKEGFCDYSVKCFQTEIYQTDKNNWKNGFAENKTDTSKKTETKPTHERLPKPEKYVPPTSLKDRINKSLQSFEETKAANKEHLDKVLGRNQPEPTPVIKNELEKPCKPAKPRVIDESMKVPPITEIGIMEFNEYNYTISSAKLEIKIIDGEIWLSPEIEASYENKNEELDSAVCDLNFYFNGKFNTHLTDISELKGARFICDTEMQPDSDYSDGAFLYVVEHEEVTEGVLEIIDIDDTNITFRWYGQADVGWNDWFGYAVAFNGTAIATINIEKD